MYLQPVLPGSRVDPWICELVRSYRNTGRLRPGSLRVAYQFAISGELHFRRPYSYYVPDRPAIRATLLAAAPKDSTLLQKIEGLNAKARASDGRQEAASASSREEHMNMAQFDESVAVEGTSFPKTVPERIVSSRQSTLPEHFNTVHEVSAPQKKRGTKSGKTKNKHENPLPGLNLQLQVSKQSNSDKALLESGKMEASQSEVDTSSVQAVKEDVEQLPKQDSLVSDESHVKVNNHWKSQPPRKISRNAQANKVADRSHGNDATIWAPVRSHQRLEGADEAGRKLAPDSVAATTKNDDLGHNSVKSKRAEMERCSKLQSK